MASEVSIHWRNTTPPTSPMMVATMPTSTLSLTTTPSTVRIGSPKARIVACSRRRSSTVIRVALKAIRSARIKTAPAVTNRKLRNWSSASSIASLMRATGWLDVTPGSPKTARCTSDRVASSVGYACTTFTTPSSPNCAVSARSRKANVLIGLAWMPATTNWLSASEKPPAVGSDRMAQR